MLALALALLSIAFAGDLAALDAVDGWQEHAWGSPVARGMTRIGGNGDHRVHYAPSAMEELKYGKYQLAAASYEYADGKLATVVWMVKHPFDAEGIAAELVAAYGEPTHQDELRRVWKGEKVRLVWRQQSADLWVVTWSYLPLHQGEPKE
jgi:hypothetical protein